MSSSRIPSQKLSLRLDGFCKHCVINLFEYQIVLKTKAFSRDIDQGFITLLFAVV